MNTTQLALAKIKLIGDAIKEAGQAGIINGTLYAMVMGYYSLEEYKVILNGLKNASLITENNYLLKWSA